MYNQFPVLSFLLEISRVIFFFPEWQCPSPVEQNFKPENFLIVYLNLDLN